MKRTAGFILTIYLILPMSGCNNRQVDSMLQVEKIEVGPGPEDMVIDSLNGGPRLLISCSARREPDKPFGEIISFDLQKGIQHRMVRTNEPRNLLFHPHGIYLDQNKLYVISHEKEPGYHPVLIYRVKGDSLEFEELIDTRLQISPNALVTGKDGEIYFVNDSGKRGSLSEKIFKLKRASVVKLVKDSKGNWSSVTVAEKLGYPAGINRMGDTLFVGDAILNRIHVYKITNGGLSPENEMDHLKGNDNIRIYKDQLMIPCHIKPFRFIRHAKDPKRLSPVEVFQVDPETGETTSLFYSDGSLISAGSTALIFENHLYICQVFNPFILKVELSN